MSISPGSPVTEMQLKAAIFYTVKMKMVGNPDIFAAKISEIYTKTGGSITEYAKSADYQQEMVILRPIYYDEGGVREALIRMGTPQRRLDMVEGVLNFDRYEEIENSEAEPSPQQRGHLPRIHKRDFVFTYFRPGKDLPAAILANFPQVSTGGQNSLYDIGCGTGWVSEFLRLNGINVKAYDNQVNNPSSPWNRPAIFFNNIITSAFTPDLKKADANDVLYLGYPVNPTHKDGPIATLALSVFKGNNFIFAGEFTDESDTAPCCAEPTFYALLNREWTEINTSAYRYLSMNFKYDNPITVKFFKRKAPTT